MSRKRLRMILICNVIAVLIFACWNAFMTQKKQIPMDLEVDATTPEDLFIQVFGGETHAVLNEDGLCYVCGKDKDTFFRILVTSKDANGWQIDEVIPIVSYASLIRFTGGSAMSQYFIYKSEKHKKDIVLVNKIGSGEEKALLEISPSDSLNSSFVCFCTEVGGSLYYEYYTIHDSSDGGYEVYLQK